MSWDLDNAGRSNEDQSEKVNFTKFPEGITRITVLSAEPHVRWTHYQRRFNRSINCPGRGCPICEIRQREKQNKQANTHPVAKRFSLEVYNHDTGRIELMDQGKNFMEELRDIREDVLRKGQDFHQITIDVKRRGLDKDNTKYRLDVADEHLPVPSDLERIDRDEYFKLQTPEQILEILNVPNGSQEDMIKAWIEITTGNKQEEEQPHIELA